MKKAVLSILVVALLCSSSAFALNDSFLYIGECTYNTEEFACAMMGLDFLFTGYTAVECNNFWLLSYNPDNALDGVFLWAITGENHIERITTVMSDMPDETCFCLSKDAALAYIPYADKEVEGWEVFTEMEDFTEAMLALE